MKMRMMKIKTKAKKLKLTTNMLNPKLEEPKTQFKFRKESFTHFSKKLLLNKSPMKLVIKNKCYF